MENLNITNSSYCNVLNFGAKANGKSDDSQAITDAINYLSKKNGGTLFFPAGDYLTGPIILINNITLYIDSGAIINFIDDFNNYPPVPTRWEGVECYGHSPLLYGNNLENVSIIGRGILNGNGKKWWDERHKIIESGRSKPETKIEKKLALLNPGYESSGSGGGGREVQFLRPPIIQLLKCNNIRIDGITCKNSPFWNTHLVYCNNVNISNSNFLNPSNAPNTDGMDIDSCTNVHISNCTYDVGDDCLCIKSGIDKDGRRVGKSTENVTITNCTMLHGHSGVAIGSEIAGDVRNIAISNCIFIGTDRGIRIKSRRGRGGIVEDIHANNIIMKEVICPIVINLFYKCGSSEKDKHLFSLDELSITEETPTVRNISLSNITAREVYSAAGILLGLPENKIRNIRLDNIEIEMTKDQSKIGGEAAMIRGLVLPQMAGVWAKFIQNARFTNVNIIGANGEQIAINNSKDINIDGNKK